MSFSEDESLVQVETKFEDNPEKIDWFFVTAGKSVAPGVLHTHISHFKFYRAGGSKDDLHLYFTC